MSIHQKQIESANLSAEVEQWLAQNAVKSLPMGFTHFPDGNIPVSKNKPKQSEAERLQKEREREEQNALVREQKEADRIKRKADAYQRKLQREREARAAKKSQKMIEFQKNLEASKGQIKEQVKRKNKERIKAEAEMKVAAVAQAKPVQEPDENSVRWNKNREAKLKAVEAGVKYFTADCKHHGVGSFYLSKKGVPRCYACRLETNRNRKRSKMDAERIEDAERVLRNKARKVVAHAAGERNFVGECKRCGESVFEVVIIKNMVSCRCADCRRALNRKSRAGKRAELQGE